MKKNFDIFYTSDVHGKVFPVDYGTGKERKCGLLNYASDITKTGNTLVLDGGDSLQGTPMMSYYLEHRGEFSFQPMAEAFSEAGLDYFTFGNHDFNFGYDVLKDYVLALKEKGAHCLCANVVDQKGEIPILPYVIHTLENGLRIGITGIVTDYVNIWEDPKHLENLLVMDPLETVESVFQEIFPQCDLTVCIYHGGYEEDLESGKSLTDSRENIACEIAKYCDFDILLTGHQHMATEGRSLYGAFTLQPAANLDSYFHIKASAEVEDGQLTAISFNSRMEQVGSRHNDRTYRMLYALEEKTQKWLDETVGNLKEELKPEEKLDVALHGSSVAALFNEVQLQETHADFSCTGLGNVPIGLPKDISIRSIYTAYPFANTTIVKEVSKETLREALERCAEYLDLDEEGKPYISDRFTKPKVEHYNYDVYAGLDYAFDIRKPIGERVVRLRKLDGTELKDGEVYRLALSNYRATGTGGYPMLGEAKEVYSGADNVQDLLVKYIREKKLIEIPENYKFEVLY